MMMLHEKDTPGLPICWCPLPPIYNAENILTENNSMALTWTASITLKAKNLILLKKTALYMGGRGRAANVFFVQILCQILRPRL